MKILKGPSDEETKEALSNLEDVNQVSNGNTQLMRACMWGYFDIVQLLVENGADVNITCCYYSLLGDFISEADFKQSKSANIGKKYIPVNALWCADNSAWSNEDVYDYLIEHGAIELF